MTPFTRRLEDCRKRWHHRTLRFVLSAAQIIRAARKAAKDERRWGDWIRNETHITRATVYRYLRVAEFFKANVSLRKHLESLSIAKIYALSRMKLEQAVHLIRDGQAANMNDVAFLKLAARLQPKPRVRVIRSNLLSSLDAILNRLDRIMRRWQHSELIMPSVMRLKVQARILALGRTLDRMRRSSAAAM